MAEQYDKNDDYKARVTALFANEKKEFPVVANAAEPVVNVLRYHHLGIACANVAVSAAFYAKFGFQRISGNDLAAKGNDILVLTHSNGLSLHLLQADSVPSGPPHNVLMDNATSKAPGHTHASWTVPSVPAVKDFLAGLGVELSGILCVCDRVCFSLSLSLSLSLCKLYIYAYVYVYIYRHSLHAGCLRAGP
jgi:catechol 2,3-dioxygenase-like lactoylglutathione lyase family enzyme